MPCGYNRIYLMNSHMKPQGSDDYFDLLTNPQFHSQGPIWSKKEELIPCKNFKDRFHFYKIGKTFGMYTQRVLTVNDGKLFYYENERSEETKGFCEVTNLYCGFFVTKQKYPYLIKLTNYSSVSEIFIHEQDQFQRLKTLLAKFSIQINFDDEFKLVEKIGEGSFSKVYVAKKKQNGSIYAVKIVKKFDTQSAGTLESVKQEKAVLEICSSDYCSRFYQFYEDAHHYYFVLEYLPGKSLMSIIKQQMVLSIDKKILILKGVLEALDYIHSKGVADRDVKPQNIIVNLETFKPKLIDFGLALFIRQETPLDEFKRCGTMGYIAPEIIKSVEGNRVRYSEKVDIFSFGIVAHILLFGFNPLKGKTYEQTFQKNKEFDIKLDLKTLDQQYGQNCGQFLKGLLEYTSSKRLSAREALYHPFLNSSHHQQKKQLMIVTRRQSINFEEQHAKSRHQSPRKRPIRRVLLE